MDKSNFLRQGRSQEYADNRIKNKLRAKGCLHDSKSTVVRLDDGERIFRCPRSICDSSDSISHFSQYSEMREGGIVFNSDRQPWKWHQVIRRVKSEVSQVRKLELKNAKSG